MSEIEVLTKQAKKDAIKPIMVMSLNDLLKQKQIAELRLTDSIFTDLQKSIGFHFTKRRFYKLCRNAHDITLKEAVVLSRLFGADVADLIKTASPAEVSVSEKFEHLR